MKKGTVSRKCNKKSPVPKLLSLDELVEISKRGNTNKPDDGSHEWANEWNYRTAFFEDSNGNRYRFKISVGIKDNISNAYNISDKKMRGKPRKGPSPDTSIGGARSEATSQKVVYQTSSDMSSEKTSMQLAYEEAMRKKQEKSNGSYSFKDEESQKREYTPAQKKARELIKNSIVRRTFGDVHGLEEHLGTYTVCHERKKKVDKKCTSPPCVPSPVILYVLENMTAVKFFMI